MMKKKPDVSGQDAATYWYKSHFHYDYDKEPQVLHAHAGMQYNKSWSSACTNLTCNFFLKTAPFTQLVWHSSTKFGCGKARSRSGKVVAVAYYEPRGNVPGQFHENVLPPVIDSDNEEDQSFEESKESKLDTFLKRAHLISCLERLRD